MRRTKWNNNPHKVGPTRIFTLEQLEDAEQLTAVYGARRKELAEWFEVDISTIDYWMKHYPSFCKAVKKGRLAMGLKVAKAVVARAVGYSHPAVHIMANRVTDYNEEGIPTKSYTVPLKVPIIKHYPPDATAGLKWLKIMFREVWTELNTSEHNLNISGSIDHNHKKIEEIPVKELSEKQQQILLELNLKQISNGQRN